MAQMVPSQPPAADRTPESELAVYRVLQSRLPDSWSVHHRFPWLHKDARGAPVRSELDFLAVHPLHGLLGIEVVEGLTRHDGREGCWYRRLPGEEEEPLDRSPVREARLGVDALLERLQSHRDWESRWVTVGHSVCAPDRSFDPSFSTSDMPREILIDQGDLRDPESALRRALAFHAHPERPGTPGRDVASIVMDVRGESRRFAERLSHALVLDDTTISWLTQRQMDALSRTEGNPRMAFAGCAGSGKTFLAIEKAVRLSRSSRKVLLTCYNKPLEQFLRSRLEGEGSVSVRTFHALCLGFARRAEVPVPARPPRREDAAEEYWIRTLPEAFERALDVLTDRFDAVIVDEGQDFRPQWWRPLERIIDGPDDKGSFYVFYDDNQALYRHGRWRLPEDPMFRYHLDENIRNTRSIHETLLAYYRRTEGGTPVAIGPRGRPVELTRYRGRDGLVPALARTLNRLVDEQGVPPGEIAILTPHGSDSPIYRLSRLGGTAVSRDRNEQGVTIRPPDDAVLATSIYRFKGLERQVVILVESEDIRPDRRDEMLYVGGSRARGHLVILERGASVP